MLVNWIQRTLAGLMLIIGLVQSSQAEVYPAHPIKIIVPFGAGTATDTVARLVGQHLSDAFKQPVVVDNKAGANGVIGTDAVAKSAADGYTLLFSTNTTQAANLGLLKKLPYNPTTDFAPIALIGNGTFILASRPDAPFQDLAQFVTYAKANPGKVSYGTGNSSGIVSGAMLTSKSGLDLVHVPYKSTPAAINDVLGGQVSAVFVDLQSGLTHIKAGKLKGIALTSAKGNAILPELPVLATAPGMSGFDLTYWMAVYAPAGTPDGVLQTLNREIRSFIERREIVERFKALGFNITSGTTAELGRFTAEEQVKWKGLVAAAGIEPE